jgi:hypothetical protein
VWSDASPVTRRRADKKESSVILATNINVALFAPLIAVQLVLAVVALVDLVRREHVTGGNKWVWAAIIVVISTLGPILYFIVGRRDA